VILDATYFYPASGGQRCDSGTIGGAVVTEVRESPEGEVIHVTASPPPEGNAACTVDWKRRFDHMQQHTGQHVLSRAFIEVAGAETVSFHMGEETCTIDLAGGGIDPAKTVEAEALANRVIWEDRKVKVEEVDPSEAGKFDLRKPLPAGAARVRLVEVEGFDVCPCCGTHVGGTGELGLVKVVKLEKVKQGTRVHFKVGGRAYRDYVAKHELVSSLMSRLTTSPDGIADKISKLMEENRSLKKALKNAEARLVGTDHDRLLAGAEDIKGVKIVSNVIKGCSPSYLRSLAASFKGAEKSIAVLVSEEGLLVGNASPDIEIDLAGIVMAKAEPLGAKGGGSGGFVNAVLPPSADFPAFLEEVREDVKKRL